MQAKHIVVIIGYSEAGKSQVYNLLSGKREFEEKPPLRVGPQPPAAKKYSFNDTTIEIKYMDYGPNIKGDHIAVINSSLAKASKICLVFDSSDPDWEEKLNRYLNTSGIEIPDPKSIILVGTKADLLDVTTYTSREKRAKEYAKEKFDTDCQLISTKTKIHLEELAQQIVHHLPEITFVEPTQSKATMKRRESLGKILKQLETEHDFMEPDDFIQLLVTSSPTDLEKNEDLIGKVGSSTKKRGPNDKRTHSGRLNRSLMSEFNNSEFNSPYRSQLPPSPSNDTYIAFSLRLAGMAIMLAALTNLIYLAIVATGFLSSVAVTAAVSQVIITVGGLLGISAPMSAFGNLCATLGMSTTLSSGLLAASASLVTLGIGYGLRSLGLQTSQTEERPQAASYFTLSFALRLASIILMATALINLIYVLLIAANVLSAATLTAGMNQLLVTVGGLLGISSPVAAFANVCASVGLSTPVATEILSATGSVLLGGLGYGLFRQSRPVETNEGSGLEHQLSFR